MKKNQTKKSHATVPLNNRRFVEDKPPSPHSMVICKPQQHKGETPQRLGEPPEYKDEPP